MMCFSRARERSTSRAKLDSCVEPALLGGWAMCGGREGRREGMSLYYIRCFGAWKLNYV